MAALMSVRSALSAIPWAAQSQSASLASVPEMFRRREATFSSSADAGVADSRKAIQRRRRITGEEVEQAVGVGRSAD